jgi:hypothetical protein
LSLTIIQKLNQHLKIPVEELCRRNFADTTLQLSISVFHEAPAVTSLFLIGFLIISSLALLAPQNGRVLSNCIHWTPGGAGSTPMCALVLTGRFGSSRFSNKANTGLLTSDQ